LGAKHGETFNMVKMMTSQTVEGKWICTDGYGRFRGEWVKYKKVPIK